MNWLSIYEIVAAAILLFFIICYFVADYLMGKES